MQVWLGRLAWAAVGGVAVGGGAGSYGTARDIGKAARENAPLLIGAAALLIYLNTRK